MGGRAGGKGLISLARAVELLGGGYYLMPRQGVVAPHVTHDAHRDLFWVSDTTAARLVASHDIHLRKREGFGYARRTTAGRKVRKAQSSAKRLKGRTMFETPDVVVTLDTMKIGSESTSDGDVRIVELRIVVPILTSDLAYDCDPRMREHLFAKPSPESDAWEHRREVESATWQLEIPKQIMSVRSAEGTAAHRFAGVRVKRVQTKAVKDSARQSLILLVDFEQPPSKDLSWLAHHVTESVAVSFEPQQEGLV